MRWTALVPLKGGADRKSRLSARLSSAERTALSDRMARHVRAVLGDVQQIGRTLLLSPQPLPGVPGWHPDAGRGLNAELEAARAALGLPLLVIHADLPLLRPDDVAELLDMAEKSGIAIAPDRHGGGTNAIALARAGSFRFAFGADSFDRHRASAGAGVATVRRWRLSLDVDTPEDLDFAATQGFVVQP